MDTSPAATSDPSSSDGDSNSGTSNDSRIYEVRLPPALNLFRSPLSVLLEYCHVVPASTSQVSEQTPTVNDVGDAHIQTQLPNSIDNLSSVSSGEVSIQIIRQENVEATGAVLDNEANAIGTGENVPLVPPPSLEGNTSRNSSYQSYDIQQFARCIEQVLPFSLLLLVVFIRQHLQGVWASYCVFKERANKKRQHLILCLTVTLYKSIIAYNTLGKCFFFTVWITAVIFKSNDILCKQTALKGERNNSILVMILIGFMFHVIGIYLWFWSNDLLYPLVMIPPSTIPPFWHAVFIILVNDTMVRQAAMAIKCLLLIYYKNSGGQNFRRQGQILTLVEYALLFYRALLPAPVWYRFFLNKEYGTLFSSLTTGLYLTFKLTTIVEKVQCFLAAIRALSRKEVPYGSYATTEQVNAAGDLCAICQEKMQAPILLQCKHIFCEDCVSEWLERERTCPLCRALVKSADLQSFGDGSTSLFFQLF